MTSKHNWHIWYAYLLSMRMHRVKHAMLASRKEKEFALLHDHVMPY